MGVIKVMSESLSNKIAAGEVVERVSSVVKELVENSIDAGSTNIKVCLVDAGIKEIRVVDNGKGMAPDDALLAFTPHATSKIKNENDLFFINISLYIISNIKMVIVGNNININGFKIVVISFVSLYFNNPLTYNAYITNGKKTMI